MKIEDLTIRELTDIKKLIKREIFNINQHTAWDDIRECNEVIDGASKEMDYYEKLLCKITEIMKKKLIIIQINEEERKLLIQYLKYGVIYSKSVCKSQCQEILQKFARQDDYIERFIEAINKEEEQYEI